MPQIKKSQLVMSSDWADVAINLNLFNIKHISAEGSCGKSFFNQQTYGNIRPLLSVDDPTSFFPVM